MKNTFYLLGVLLIAFNLNVKAQKGLPAKAPTSVNVSTFYPQHEDFKASLVSKIKVPNGFSVAAVATGLGKPRMMAINEKGGLYITRRDVGDVLMLEDKDGDGKFESLKTVWSQFLGVHGITIHDGYLYLCSDKVLKRGKIASDGSLTDTTTLISDLPEGSQHDNRVIAFGPDNLLYISVGSSCNDCAETNAEHATLLQVQSDFKSRKIFARGLRNTIGFDWNPETKEIWGADNGTDWRSDEFPPEELNKIMEDKDYGWPRVFAKQQVDETREDPVGTTKAAYAKTTEPSVMEFPAHSAPIDFKFMTGLKSFPKEYQDDALVCWHGSWNRKNPEGYKVQRIKFENGKPTGVEDFFSGFLSADGKTRFGRPAGLALSPRGVLYISDDESGVIYSVSAVK
ncbi:PQQ-dependent sugar dehydrogenase [Pedobacter mucosus]|uniref:PQQ-dependent sugar dehydrogenase n=1 Tax=Pedobacter mucosus TaxID=2895286 RepID=UPI001EE48B31|nr:PQQ-dependent sugar dehydrogenase [Pedobacter mucosus]UKT65268.1 PQQ-dependent sugar dehydrogenase [Pedobacter mucosus]